MGEDLTRRRRLGWLFGALVSLAPIARAHAAPAVWVCDESGYVGTVDVATGAYTFVGRATEGGAFVILTDIAFCPSGTLFGVSMAGAMGTSTLYRIDPTSAALTPIGATGRALEGLGCRDDGALFASGGNTVFAVDATTGATGAVVVLPSLSMVADDLDFAGGALYVAAHQNQVGPTYLRSYLLRADLGTGGAVEVGPMNVPLVYGMARGPDGILYGVSYTDLTPAGTERVVRVDLATGAGTTVVSLPDTFPPSGILGATFAPAAPAAGPPPPAEVCGNCVDDDGNGQVDFEEPQCCGTTGTIKMRRATLRLRGKAGLLNLETQVGGLTGIDPRHQDLHVLLRHENSTLVFCGTMPAARFKKRLKVFQFLDRKRKIASAAGVDGVVVRALRTKRHQLHVQGKKAVLTNPAPGKIRTIVAWRDPATAEAGNRCATTQSTMRAAGTRKSVRFP